MKNQIVKLLLLLLSINIYSQVKVDTLSVTFNQLSYQEKANYNIEKLIKYNIKIKNEINKKSDLYDLLYDGKTSDLKIISIPIFNFKKEVKNFIEGENLISYIDFTSNASRQHILSFYKSNLIYDINVNDIDFENIDKNYKDNINSIEGMLVQKRTFKPVNTTSYDLPFHFENKFFFLLLDRLCIVINGDIFVLTNEGGGIKMTEFNNVFIPNIDEVKKKTAGSNESTSKINDEHSPIKTKIYLKLIW